jgi:hypothetical protein
MLKNLRYSKFRILGERPASELLIGLAGKFWTPWGDLQDVNADNFKAFDKAVMQRRYGIFRWIETAKTPGSQPKPASNASTKAAVEASDFTGHSSSHSAV